MESKHSRVAAPGRVAGLVAVCMLALGCFAGSAFAKPLSHGQVIQLRQNANQSSNWFGYNQGTLEKSNTLFNSITGDWTVPSATQHNSGQAESSSDWIGIGGGCIDAGCTLGDPTLIQTGTEQDVDASGKPSYSTWWEIIPGPSIAISGVSASPGDRMHADIHELVPNSNVWSITLQNVTKGQSFTQTVPYASTHATAEWIEETPTLIGSGGVGLAALPNLSNPAFSNATVNGANAGLKSSEAIDLIDSNGNVIGTPSAPNSSANGCSACTWATSC
jgi:peptidase A4-like protein